MVTTSDTDTPGRLVLAGGILAGLAALVLLHLQRGPAYWNFSEGVYAYSSRLLLHGGDLYGHVVAAQPPGLFLAGAGILALEDSLDALRWALGLVQLAGGLVAARAVWRLTGSAWASAAAPALALVTPWAVHEHGALTPELFAPPLLLGGALLAARRERAVAGGALAALAVLFKLPFLIPVALLVLAAADRRRAALGAGGVLVAGALGSLAAFGTGVWDQAVLAQTGTGRAGLHTLGGYVAQAGWSLAGLLLLAAAAVALRDRLADAVLLRTLSAAALGLLLTVASVWKQGTALNVLAPVEAGLVPLALAGAWALVRVRGRSGTLAVAAALGFTLAATAALLLAPQRTRPPFLYPTSATGAWGRGPSGAAVDAAVARARRCPPGVPYPGTPFIAFLARRPMPDGQPDLFLATRSPRLRATAAAIAADARRCPASGP